VTFPRALLHPVPALIVLFASLLLLAGPAQAANKKHHLTLALGYEKLLSNDLKDQASGVDFTSSGYGAIAYRFSVQRNLDLTLDARGTTHTETFGGVDFTLTNSFFGPGVRMVSPNEGMRPYVQANFFLVREEIKGESGGVTITSHDSSAGFGVSGGVDIRGGNLLSIPIEVNYMYGKPSDDVSGIGVNAGITFNFGMLNK
jgi:hypothetical protein